MNARAIRRYEMLVRVHAFGDAYAGQFAAGTIVRSLFTSVGKCVADVSKHAVKRESHHVEVRNTADSKARARRRLFGMLVAIRRTARAIAIDRVGYEKRFELPRGNSDPTLLTSSRAFARHSQERVEEFIAYGLPSGFVEDLAGAIDAFEQALRARAASRAGRKSSNHSIKTTIDDGCRAVRRLDAVVFNVLGHDPRAVARWARARRVAKIPRRRPQP